MTVNRMIALFLAVLLLLTVLPAGVFATEVTSGICGDNLTWSVDDNVLTIVGTGPMDDYNRANEQPWIDCAHTITEVVIGEGVTSVGQYAFSSCDSLLRVELPDTLRNIGMYGFNYCKPLSQMRKPRLWQDQPMLPPWLHCPSRQASPRSCPSPCTPRGGEGKSQEATPTPRLQFQARGDGRLL